MVTVTVIRVLLFVLDVSMLRECKGDGNAREVDGGGVVAVSTGHEYSGGIRGSGIVSSKDDVLEMSVVRGIRGVGRVCELCMCLARGDVGGGGCEWIRGLGLGFTIPLRTG